MGLSTSTKDFDTRVKESLDDAFMQKAVAKAQDDQWVKRETSRENLGNWEEWRDLGEQIRQHTLENLDFYLEQFSDNVTKNGGKVFFASTEQEATDYVKDVIRQKNAKKIVKSKSMVTTEIDLDRLLLEMDGVSVMETDLAEFILQMDDWDEPSHIVFPDIHKNREQIRLVFKEKLGYDGDNEPEHMARFAREVLREFFLDADVGITGCNFAIASSGMVNLVTNEGNADLCESIPDTQIVLMGMERIVPNMADAEVMDNLLSRSAVGQSLTSYITFSGPKLTEESDGPDDFHVVILDNKRSEALGTEFQSVLQCIRCGSCLNVCPVYRTIGGHGYGSIYPGPIGAVLSPVLGGYEQFGELPYASSLCGACTDTCPVKIPLHGLLIEHRRVMTDELKMGHGFVDQQMRFIAKATSSPFLFKQALKFGHVGLGVLGAKPSTTTENLYQYGGFINGGFGLIKGWTSVRDLPRPPKERDNFRSWYKNREQGGAAK
ncbi:iron-sulfur cluster-binding protein [Listeria sp. SHR_NRA_18]|uniref:LutB/LldF family L-lactate oxidation iron-sulfur protein n=1 Tax=Listeria sp. SHR_NRA_18 TaxID=2269046 RepID=UPI00051DF687|nr:LutB/LldF family L-lactate oxidation iron-sulfur protein [Listeria sp. SHR_NRA_18]KGL39652.1 amino acid dehydrogenase [Listeriaceae bacterium FSL A5-0209]RQW67194.1 iron-sulfur cluster-binding protein [Listeria sp. SHR_NRA_18]